MDIIEFLTQDHEKIRSHLTAIGKSLNGKRLTEEICDFIAHFELHETVEEKILFPKLSEAGIEDVESDGVLFDYEKDHTQIWAKIEELRNLVEEVHYPLFRKAFYNFDAFAEAHMRCEERIIFSSARKLLDQSVLDDLGKKAREFTDRFATQGGRAALC